MNRRSQTLYRDPDDKMIGGVCSGLAHYFDIDTILVRVAFVVVALLGGGGLLAYALLWAILDPAPPTYFQQQSEPPTVDSDPSAAPMIDGEMEQPQDSMPTAQHETTDEL